MRKQAKFIFLLVLLAMAIALCGCSGDKVFVDEGMSYLSGFEVVDGKVMIRCHVTLTNDLDTEKTVKLSASLPDDVEGGLLKEGTIMALDKNGEEATFVLSPNSTESFNVVFVGEYAGTNVKHDKFLPDISIEIVE